MPAKKPKASPQPAPPGKGNQGEHLDRQPELVFGFVAPVGVNLSAVVRKVAAQLARFGYHSETIKTSDYFRDLKPWADLSKTLPYDERLEGLMDSGDELRRATKRKDAAALNALKEARARRRLISGDQTARRLAFLIKSLKTPQEIETLRAIYGGRFICIGTYAPRPIRLRDLAKRIATSRNENKSDRHAASAEKLLFRDENGVEEDPYGQNVAGAYPAADFFVDASDLPSLKEGLKPLFDLLFGDPFITPTRDEQGMFLAYGASFRSSSLSRQVGAAITTRGGNVIAIGTNEVPKAGGGLYWPGDSPDMRDFQFEEVDLAFEKRRNVLANALHHLLASGWRPKGEKKELSEEKKREIVTSFVSRLLQWDKLAEDADSKEELKKLNELRRGLLVSELIEFHRAVHAEMAAIIDAASRGIGLHGAVLYTRTFPCHDCARCLAASGIARVVYLEPYAKSLVAELHNDVIAIDAGKEVTGSERSRPDRTLGPKVVFEPFVGVAPWKYATVFRMQKRKTPDGGVAQWNEQDGVPRSDVFDLPANDTVFERFRSNTQLKRSLELEEVAVRELEDVLPTRLAAQK